MFGIGVTELIVVGVIVSVPLVLIFLAMYALRKSEHSGRTSSSEETQLLQEVLRGLKRLEDRVDSLESTLLDRGGKN